MTKLTQTFARIGTGLAAIGALCWLLWPSDFKSVYSNPEAIFVFSVALITWVFTEFKDSEEVQLREATPNDIRIARTLIKLHANKFRSLLCETDLFQYVPSSYYSELNELCRRNEQGTFEFQNGELNEKLADFFDDLKKLSLFVAQHTVPERIGGEFKTGFKPYEIVCQERYDELLRLSQQANDMATTAWERLDSLVSIMKTRVPEAWDQEI